ncbi:hypothetical protein SGRA_2733 [Saprospira grandis str. Lewin]|uniref:Uncharacterized protein n=1 Tax=Saprospira grandis (strain Lewin) TaxID=984262 RepID=H6L9I5_SAPGL|nr:hypothetical protein SGRA_2733 [Saprospira grandis str. Lewin]
MEIIRGYRLGGEGVNCMRVSTLIRISLRSNTNRCLAVGFNLQAQIAGPKGRRPSDAKGGGEAADRGAEGDEGPSRAASPEA